MHPGQRWFRCARCRSLLHRAAAGRRHRSARPAPRVCSRRHRRSASPSRAAGEHLYDVRFDLQGLPDPASLGPYTTYVAWATTPQLHPVVKLGDVRNGIVTLGRVAFDRTPDPDHGRSVGRGDRARAAVSCCAAPRPACACSRTIWRSCWRACSSRRDCAGRPIMRIMRAGRPHRRLDAAADASRGHDAAGADDAAARRVAVPRRDGRSDPARAAARAAAACATARADARRRTGPPRPVRPHRDDARLQRPVSRSADPGRRGLDDRRAVHQPAPTFRRPCTGTACGSTTGSTASPHVTQDPVPPGRLVRVPRALPRCRASTGITRIIARTCCRTSASTAICSCARAIPDFFAPANREEVLMLDDLLVGDDGPRRLRPRGADARADGPLRQRAARERRAALGHARAPRRGRAALPHQRLEHARLQPVVRRARAATPHEGRRLGSRPLRARGLGRPRHHRAGRALRRRRALRRARRASRSSIACAPSITSRRASSRSRRRSASCACAPSAATPDHARRVRAPAPQRRRRRRHRSLSPAVPAPRRSRADHHARDRRSAVPARGR